jgi:alpha-tubulin suppressor-like RCC1 family protein
LAGILGLVLAGITCNENVTAPNRPGPGVLRAVGVLPANIAAAGLVFDNVHLVVVRPSRPSPAVLDKTYDFPAGSSQLNISEQLLLQATSEDFDVTLEYRSGNIVLFSGTSRVTVHQGPPGSDPPAVINVTLQVGNNVTAITVAPKTSSVPFGGTATLSATAQDAQGAPVTQFYVGWSSSDPQQPVDAAGVFTAGSQRDTVTITAKALTASGPVTDQATVIVMPAPAAVAVTNGNGQSAPAGFRLPQPLEVEVRGSDNLPISGVTVTFAVTSGGGTLDSTTTTTDAQGRARTGATLGASVSQQTFTGTVPGITPAIFTETATGIVPVPVLLSVGGDHSCEIRGGGSVYCWGSNGSGELGDGTTTDRAVATPVVTGQSFGSLALGDTHSCALTGSGQAFCWGDNSSGALGDGTTTNRSAPTAVAGVRTFIALTAGDRFTCGLTAAGQAFCWGRNNLGQLGDGTVTQRRGPTAVSGGLIFSSIGAGGSHACALTATGAAHCWGLNLNGQLGDGTTTDRQVPTAVLGGITFGALAPANRSTCALDSNGAGYCWGFNFGASITTPQPTNDGRTYVSADMGGDHVCALLASGAAFCGGRNANGQLGDGTTTDQPVSVAVAGGHTYTAVAGGTAHTCGLTSTGTLCWGANNAGQLGDGTTAQRLTPAAVLGPPASVSVNGGDNQTAGPDSPVAIPPSVLVLDGQSNPLPGVQVDFTVTSGGGGVSGGSTFTDAAGIATVGSWFMGPGQGPNTLLATVGASGITGNPLTFHATASIGAPLITWTGFTSTNWSTATNWNPAQVPTTAEDVVIPAGTPNSPQLTASGSAKSLTVNSGATLDLNGINFQAAGNVFADGSIVGTSAVAIATAAQIRGNLPSLILSGPVAAAGTISASGNLTVTGPTGDFDVSGQAVLIGGNLTTQASALLTMTNPADLVQVTGNGAFGGGDETGRLTAGVLQVMGDFSQTSGSDPTSFLASGTHRTVLGSGASTVVTFASPISNNTGSHFQDLDVSSTSNQLTLNSDVFVAGTLIGQPSAGANLLTGSVTRTLDVGGIAVRSMTLNNVLLVVGNGTLAQIDNLTFAATPAASTALTINHPGLPAAFTLNNVVFQTTPTSGMYLSANDTDGPSPNVLTLDMANPSPGTPGSFVQVTNGAVVTWPSTLPAVVWTGAVSSAWGTAGNWNPAIVPATTDNVLIPSGTPNDPQTGIGRTVNDLTIQGGATLTLTGPVTIVVDGNLDVQGVVSNTAGGLFRLSGTGKTVRGNIQGAAIFGAYTQNGPLVVASDFVIRGDLTVNGQTLSVSNNLNLLSAGRLFMTNPADQVVVSGDANFRGGSTAGTLTEGNLFIAGNLAQDNSGTGLPATSFSPSRNHTTWFTGGGVQQVDIFNTGTGAGFSHFANLNLSAATGSVTLVRFNTVFVDGILTSHPVSTQPVLTTSNAAKLQVEGVDVDGLVLDNLPLLISGGPLTKFNRVTLQNYSPSAVQLTVSHPGAATPFTFDQLVFSTPPTTGGAYLQADDIAPTDGVVLTLDLTNPSPSTPGGFVVTTGGAVIDWPAAGGVALTWAGTVSSDWNDAGNWSPARVPGTSDDVVIPAATPNAPQLTSVASARDLTVLASQSLDLAGFNLQVLGNISIPGQIISTGGDVLLNGVGKTANGTINTGVVVSGSYTLNGTLGVAGVSLSLSGSTASLDLGGFNATVSGDFQTTGGALLIMQNTADVLITAGNAIFDGGDETSLLTAGNLVVQGDFIQQATVSATSFAASGTHKTTFNQTGSSVSFANFASHFQDLELVGAITVSLGSDIGVSGKFTASQTATTLKGNGFKVVVTAVAVQALTVDNSTIVVDENGTGQGQQFDNVTFQNFPTTGVTMLQFIGPGGAAAPRNLTFNNVSFQSLPVGAGNLYVTLISSNGFGLNLTMQGSNQGRQGGGNGLTLSSPPNETTVGGATIFWP